jgi:glycosyltransferase involved in cell wall biosynthesis
VRVAIYTICKNEAKHVKQFMDCIKDEADGIFVTDTGSTDNTVELLREAGATVNVIKVDPWRFDVARNISLDFVPLVFDICLSIDLDETLTPGWCEAIKKSWVNIDRLRYQYAWSHLPDGSPGTTFWYDKCHSRRGFRWVKPVHEVLQFYNGTERQGYCHDFMLHHWPDVTKSRSSYLGLLELGCREEPEDDRNCHYLGREYMYWGQYDDAIRELKRHLSLKTATWEVERSASLRYIGRCYAYKGDHQEAVRWMLRAVAEAPGEREPWVELGKQYHVMSNWHGCYHAMKSALTITERPLSYICEPESWGSLPYDLAGLSAYYLGMYYESLELTGKAIELDPQNMRLRKNLQFAADKIRSKL